MHEVNKSKTDGEKQVQVIFTIYGIIYTIENVPTVECALSNRLHGMSGFHGRLLSRFPSFDVPNRSDCSCSGQPHEACA